MKKFEEWGGIDGPIAGGNLCKVRIKNQTQVITTPDGEVIPNQIWSRVFTGTNEPAYAIVKIYIEPKK